MGSPRDLVCAYYVQAEVLARLLQVEGLPVCALILGSWGLLAAVSMGLSLICPELTIPQAIGDSKF